MPDWTYVIDEASGIPYLIREFVFDDFKNAFLFMTQSATLAEKNQHHPGNKKTPFISNFLF